MKEPNYREAVVVGTGKLSPYETMQIGDVTEPVEIDTSFGSHKAGYAALVERSRAAAYGRLRAKVKTGSPLT